MKKLIVSLVLVVSTSGFGCAFNTDCNPGSQCVKPPNSIYGYCVGGMQPGNAYDNQPTYNPMDITGRQGTTCSFDMQCGIGGTCVKSMGQLYGVCQ